MIVTTIVFTQGSLTVKSTKSGNPCRSFRISASLATVVALAGCLQTPHTQSPRMQNSQVVVVTPQDQAARLYYSCPNGRSLDVTRVQGNSAALLVVDGKTLRLPRDTAATTAERYTNRMQTLTLFGTSASFDVMGQSNSGPCTIGAVPAGVPGAASQSSGERPHESND
jgi:membrane-bound inhibitor of C-type lysozyme